jgi:ATP-dependent helicase HrpB
MIRAKELDCIGLGADLAAILSERDLFQRSTEEVVFKDPDVSERIEVLRKWQKGKQMPGNSNHAALRAVDRTANQLRRLLPAGKDDADHESMDQEIISRLLLAAYPDRICKRREEGGGRFVLVQGRGVRLSPDSHLVNTPYIIAITVDAGEKAEGFIHIAAPVEEKVVRSECAGKIEIIRDVEWDHKEGRITAAFEDRIGALFLSRRTFSPDDEEAVPILCDVIRTVPGILSFSKEARQLQARVCLIRNAFPEETWPDLSEEQLSSRPEDWLLPWLGGIRSAQGLRALNVLPALKAMLSWEQQRLLDERAPVSITVPSGSRVTLDYCSGDQPVLAVKLQEMFGLADTPVIAKGRVKVLLHLLSPARRPVQITQDLKGFWNNGYPLVKKDLKGRYPKHPWPEDPWNAVPTKRTKRREE